MFTTTSITAKPHRPQFVLNSRAINDFEIMGHQNCVRSCAPIHPPQMFTKITNMYY